MTRIGLGRLRTALVLSGLAAALTSPSPAQQAAKAGGDGAADYAADLKILQRWVGTWNMELIVKPSVLAPEGGRMTMTGTADWTLNGKYIRLTTRGEETLGKKKLASETVSLMTFDPLRQKYRHWLFYSSAGAADGFSHWGGTPVALGSWDEDKREFNAVAVDIETGLMTYSRTKFLDADNYEWTTRLKDKDGRVLMDQEGRATRRKEGADR